MNVVMTVLRGEKVKTFPDLSVIFTDNKYIRTINKKFLNHDYSTDVIAFPLMDEFSSEAELYINLDAGRAQAKEYKVPFYTEIRRLLIHGTLHLVGYDDRTEQKRHEMRQREEWYLERIAKRYA